MTEQETVQSIQKLISQIKKDFINIKHKVLTVDCPECKATILIAFLVWAKDLYEFGDKIKKK